MLLRSVLTISLTAFAFTASADSIDINVSDDAAQFQYIAPMGSVGQGKSEVHAGFLYNDSDNTMIDAGLLVASKDATNSDLSFGVGVKALAADINSENALALALGGMVRFSPTGDKKFGITAQIFFAPDIVTFGDADSYVQTGMTVEYKIMSETAAYLGYRKIKFGIKSPLVSDQVLDDGPHIGVRVAF